MKKLKVMMIISKNIKEKNINLMMIMNYINNNQKKKKKKKKNNNKKNNLKNQFFKTTFNKIKKSNANIVVILFLQKISKFMNKCVYNNNKTH